MILMKILSGGQSNWCVGSIEKIWQQDDIAVACDIGGDDRCPCKRVVHPVGSIGENKKMAGCLPFPEWLNTSQDSFLP